MLNARILREQPVCVLQFPCGGSDKLAWISHGRIIRNGHVSEAPRTGWGGCVDAKYAGVVTREGRIITFNTYVTFYQGGTAVSSKVRG